MLIITIFFSVGQTAPAESLHANDYHVFIGNREWMAQNGLPINHYVDELLIMQEELGQTAVLVAANGLYAFFLISQAALSHLLVVKSFFMYFRNEQT